MLNEISILQNKIQYYAWGSKTAIPELLGIANPEARPMAELWMGAHPKAPSQVLVRNTWVSLIEVINSSPDLILGKDVVQRFGNVLPFLFKVLAAAEPLSIQVHPNKQQAKEGFERENKLNVPLDSPIRNYRDDNHKPELLCALTPFEALKGFRPVDEMVSLLAPVVPSRLEGPLNELKSQSHADGLRQFFSILINLPRNKKIEVVSSLLSKVMDHPTERPEFQWVLELGRQYPGDIGVFSPLLLNFIQLDPGEAIFIPAGQLHAYLRGTGLEIMANSDNVLRGGLTPKHVDVDELLRITSFQPVGVEKVYPRALDKAEEIYGVPAQEFQLSHVKVRGLYRSSDDGAVEILLCTQGEGQVKGPRQSSMRLKITKGVTVIVPSVSHPYEITGEADLWKATVSR